VQRAKLGPAQSALFATVHSEKRSEGQPGEFEVSVCLPRCSRDAAAHQSLGFASAFDFVAAAFRRAGLNFQCVSSNAAVHGYLVLIL